MVEKPRWLPFINAIQWRHKNLSALEICFSFKQRRRHENKDIFGLKAFFWYKKDSSSTTFDLNWKFLLHYHSSIHQKSKRKEIILVWNLQKNQRWKVTWPLRTLVDRIHFETFQQTSDSYSCTLGDTIFLAWIILKYSYHWKYFQYCPQSVLCLFRPAQPIQGSLLGAN